MFLQWSWGDGVKNPRAAIHIYKYMLRNIEKYSLKFPSVFRSDIVIHIYEQMFLNVLNNSIFDNWYDKNLRDVANKLISSQSSIPTPSKNIRFANCGDKSGRTEM